ncbi:hypothetical protein L596_027672 [Steinernema carpocapsae]|uniref:Uncharacterized protein n=1 Tax=Steinernema carpocapsae TaxID=34508 RepID=A0A4U5LW90_STECR|nr:hypothetical protein L596_027672 [Steinernema carpocapsae]
MRFLPRGAVFSVLFAVVDATLLMMNMGTSTVCCCGCEGGGSACPPQQATCPPPQNPCPQTSYWFGQQYQKCNSYNSGNGESLLALFSLINPFLVWRQPYSEFISSGGLQSSFPAYPPGYNANNYVFPGVATTAAPPAYPSPQTYNPGPAPPAPLTANAYPYDAAPSAEPPAAPVHSSPPTTSYLTEVEPAALSHDSESLVANDNEPFDQFDNPTDRSPQIIPILKTIYITDKHSNPSNVSDYESEYVDIDLLPREDLDRDSNRVEGTKEPLMRYVDSDILTTTKVPLTMRNKTHKNRVLPKSKFSPPKNKSVDPEMIRIGRVLGEIESMLELVKKEMEIDVYDEESPQLQNAEENIPKTFFSGEYEAEFVNILDEEDKEPVEEVAPTTQATIEVEPKKNLTMQEIIENLRMQHLRAERRKKFLETVRDELLLE